jgi:hypothetical protein
MSSRKELSQAATGSPNFGTRFRAVGSGPEALPPALSLAGGVVREAGVGGAGGRRDGPRSRLAGDREGARMIARQSGESSEGD